MKVFTRRLKSGSLQFVVFVSVLIALILAALILYMHSYNLLREQSRAGVANIQLADAGMSYILNQNYLTLNDTVPLDIGNQQNQSVHINLSDWGMYEKAFVRTQHRTKKFVKIAIVGSLINKIDSPSLYLEENFSPLTIVGDTKIEGMAYLPQQGIHPGFLNGRGHNGNMPLQLDIKRSGRDLPKAKKYTLDNFLLQLDGRKLLESVSTEKNNRVVNSFKKKTKYIFSQKNIILKDITLSGNIIVKSDTSIFIENTANLQDVILIAPIIEVADNTKGSFQAFSSNRINVGKNCVLSYPSSLTVKKKRKDHINTDDESLIFIDSSSQIAGSICYLQDHGLLGFKPQMILQSDAKIKGQVYCDGNFELKGVVSGSVYTRQFIANQNGTAYINYICDGIIENGNIPDQYGGIIWEKGSRIIMKWLY